MKVLFEEKTKVSLLKLYWESSIASYLNRASKNLAKMRGQRMAVFANDWIGILINIYGVYEREELDTIFKFLEPLRQDFNSGVALDIGANIGNHTIFFDKIFAKTFSFEPNPYTYTLLKFNSSFCRNVEAMNFGLSDSSVDCYMVEDAQNYGGSSIGGHDEIKRGGIGIRVERLDDCGLHLDRLCFIKIDVEGHEARVLRGARETIQRHQPIITFEQLEDEFNNSDQTESIIMLKQLDYKFCWIQRDKTNKSWIIRRLINFCQLFTGKVQRRRLVWGESVPKATHDLLIAIPRKHHEVLGLR